MLSVAMQHLGLIKKSNCGLKIASIGGKSWRSGLSRDKRKFVLKLTLKLKSLTCRKKLPSKVYHAI